MIVLVTGAQGFIGRYTVATWLAADPAVHVVGLGRSARVPDRFTHPVTWGHTGVPAPLTAELAAAEADHRYRYVPADLSDTPLVTELLGRLRPDVIIHLAASLRDEPPQQLVRVNVGALVSLIESIVGSGIDPPRLVLGSSGSVYGNVADRPLPLREDMECRPIDPYSVSKRAAEDMARILAAQHRLDVVEARIFNPVGPGQDERHLCGRLAQQVAAIVAGQSTPEITVGPLHTTRDYIDVRDTASALRALALRGEPGTTYNVATGIESSGDAILSELISLAGLDVALRTKDVPARAADMERHVADVTRLHGLGWAPLWDLPTSLEATLRYYLDELDPASSGAPDRTNASDAGTPSGGTNQSGGTTPSGGATAILRQPTVTLCPDRSVRCAVDVGAGLLDELPELLTTVVGPSRLAMLSDARVLDLHGHRVVDALRGAGWDVRVVEVPEGEQAKTLAEFERVIGELHIAGIDRRSVIVNFGGGAITDLGGYVAASYLRGIGYVNVPTTLLGQHDSGIGGKVAVNAPWAKNFIGAFHHPLAVICDPTVLATLAVRDLRCGVAESIKVAICGAPGLFELLESSVDEVLRADPTVLAQIVQRSAAHKIELLRPDPYEVDLRRVLNLGHTFGHALEVDVDHSELRHGEAVAFGMVVATRVALELGVCAPHEAARILDLIDRYGLLPPVNPDALPAALDRIDSIRLVRGGRLNFVLPTSTRSAKIYAELADGVLERAVDSVIESGW